MKIAQVAPLYESVPPKLYGGTERVVSYLTEALVDLGHEVTLFASGDSVTKARLRAVCHQSLRLDKHSVDTVADHVYLAERVTQESAEFDFVHSHIDYLPYPLFRRMRTPHVTTLHGRLDIPNLVNLYREFSDIPVVSISNYQRLPLSWINWQATVYHGLPADLYTFRGDPGEYLAFVGRICPEKGVEAAIEIAKRAGLPLKIAAKVDKVDEAYFKRVVKPLLDGQSVEYIGEINERQKNEFLGRAIALLFPIDWPEPFGLVMIEAMACGTPIIARIRGSVPEIMDDRATGFVIRDIDEAVRAVQDVGRLDRRRCRQVFEERFTAARMATEYLNVYRRLIGVDTTQLMSQLIEIEGQFYIAANSSLADAANRVLKHGDTFAIFDRHGDIRPLGFENHGLFHEGTRFISQFRLELNDQSPLLLSSAVKDDNDLFVAHLTNPTLTQSDGTKLPSGTIHLAREIFLWSGESLERIEISNFGLTAVTFDLSCLFRADFADVFEVRGMTREHRGRMCDPAVDREGVLLQYEGLDGVRRRTELRFGQSATEINGERARFSITLPPQENTTVELRIACRNGDEPRVYESYEGALRKIRAGCADFRAHLALLETSNAQFNDWIFQSQADLHMLITETPQGPYPFAGIPWYSCVFGRDGIITAMQTLWCYPQLARGVLAYLASTQATQSIPRKDAEPGKIVHEERKGEMAATEEVPFGNYYGTVDATPLFVALAGRYYERTHDLEFIRGLWPNIQQALAWIDQHGDLDGDGFVEYCRRTECGLGNQGWKDSEDSVFHADGSLAEAPIALCEVQGYVFEAKTMAARLASALGDHDAARELNVGARRLQERFERDFWCDEIQSYALALDGRKQQCKVRSSNAGHCLFSGIASAEHAALVAGVLASEAFFSGWGIRTIPVGAPRYNPMSYHNGSVWPHDNALVASGLARYGFKQSAANILSALFDASLHMDLNRLPELYCGFSRRPGEGPTLYPVACNPQAWAAATVFSLMQSCLGLIIEASSGRVCFDHPCLPGALHAVSIANLRLPSGQVDLSLQRHDSEVAVAVKRRAGNVEVAVVH